MKTGNLLLLTEDSAMQLATSCYRCQSFLGPKEFKSDIAKIRKISEELTNWNKTQDAGCIIRVMNTVVSANKVFPAKYSIPLILFFNNPELWSQLKTILCYTELSSSAVRFNLNGVDYTGIQPDIALLTELIEIIPHD